jgi:hypothetical protein
LVLTLEKEVLQYPQDISDENSRILSDLKRGLNDPYRLQMFLDRTDEDHLLEWLLIEPVQGRKRLKQRIKQFRKPFDVLFFLTLGTAIIQDWIGVAFEAQGYPKGMDRFLKFPVFVYLYVQQGKIFHTVFVCDFDSLAAQLGADPAKFYDKKISRPIGISEEHFALLTKNLSVSHADEGPELPAPWQPVTEGAEGTRNSLSQFLQIFAIIFQRNPYPFADNPSNIVKERDLARHVTQLESEAKLSRETYYPHTSVPDHVRQLQEEGGQDKGIQLPARLVTIQEGAKLTGVPPGTVGRWLSVGRLEERGRLWLTYPGGFCCKKWRDVGEGLMALGISRC